MTAPFTRHPTAPESTWENTLAAVYGEGLRWHTQADVSGSATVPSYEAALRRLDRPLPQRGLPSPVVISDLIRDVTTGSTHYSLPHVESDLDSARSVGVAAAWLAAVWGQNSAMTPVLAALERVTARWILELFGLPTDGLLTTHPNSQLAELRCLATAHERLLRAHPANGRATLLVGAATHHADGRTFEAPGLPVGLRHEVLSSNAQGNITPTELRAALRNSAGPVIVRATMGSGDAAEGCLASVTAIVREAKANCSPGHDVWLHIDGKHRLRAAASPRLRHQVRGYELADSWSFDSLDWLPAPAEAGIAVVRAEPSHRLGPRRQVDRPTSRSIDGDSLGAIRVLALYATIRQLGQRAIAEAMETRLALALENAPRPGDAGPTSQPAEC